jgi:hypothetical protein
MNPQIRTGGFPFFILLLSVLIASRGSAQKTEIELKDGFYYIDHQKFFIKGIGYEVGAYPGMLPWNRPFNETILRNDMNRIKDGGYNTIRTWNAFTDQEMKVVQEYGLKIIMGIWIDPAGDFSDPTFVNASLQLVSNILSYTSNYENIIGYLIMNEPLPDHIFSVGFQHAFTLWMKTKTLIHEMHPGIPVSFANTCVGDFIDPEIFDFSAYNIYPYNPSTVKHSCQYPAYVRHIYDLRHDGHPLVVTEFGLSVSPSGEGNWGYGGNTLEEQTAGILYMVRSIIDGGAGGLCVFNYSDGWWKAGDEFTHNDAAEEWFGLVEYNSLSDKYGTVRPAWDSLKSYNHAVIVSPKNQAIYNGQIPVEIFSDDTIVGFVADINGEIRMDTVINGNYFTDTVRLDLVSAEDIQMKFKFYNALHQVIKNETIQLLASDAAIQLPEILIAVTPLPLKGNHLVETTFSVVNNGPLQTDSVLDFSFYTHIGWDYGVSGSALLTGENNASYTVSHNYGDNVDVITLSAGLNASYGSFSKRIISRRDFIVGDTSYIELPASVITNRSQEYPLAVQPNPASDFITISSSGFSPQRFCILEPGGRLVANGVIKDTSRIDIHSLAAGYYVIILEGSDKRNSCIPFIKEY